MQVRVVLEEIFKDLSPIIEQNTREIRKKMLQEADEIEQIKNESELIERAGNIFQRAAKIKDIDNNIGNIFKSR